MALRTSRSGLVMMCGVTLCLGAAGCPDSLTPPIFLPAGDNTAVCRTISPGDEVSVRVGFRGRALKLQWSSSDVKLEKNGTIETLTLVATAPNDGFVQGDTNGRFKIVVSRDGGIAIDDEYRDSPLTAGQQTEHFDVSFSSDFSVNGVPLQSGAGTANVIDYKRSSNQVTIRVAFTGPILNLVTSTLENMCGEAFFDGPVQLKGF